MPDILPETDVGLLEIIHAAPDLEVRRRRDALLETQAGRPLTDAERAELIETVDAVEFVNAQRWQAIARLAERRGRSLKEIRGELGVKLT